MNLTKKMNRASPLFFNPWIQSRFNYRGPRGGLGRLSRGTIARNPANFGFRNLFLSSATPPRAALFSLSFSLFLSLFLLCSAISETRQEDALIIRSRRSFHRDGRTGRDGVRNHIFQVMPVNAANKRPGKRVPGPVSMAYASRDLDGRPTVGERKKKKRNINYAHHSPAP